MAHYIATQNRLDALIADDATAFATINVNRVLSEFQANALCSQNVMRVLYAPAAVAGSDVAHSQALLEDDYSNFYADVAASQALYDDGSNAQATQMSIQVLYDYDEISPNVPLFIPMSDYIFPDLPGLSWNVVKTPKFQTSISPHVSGREVRVSNYAYPIWTWELKYEFLRSNAEEELQELMGFFLARSGSFDTFLFADPDEDNTLVARAVGNGNNSQVKWTLTKTYGGFSEPVGYVSPASLKIYFTVLGVTTEQLSGWTFISPNQVEFAVAPATGTTITADFTWYYRVRFGEDAQNYDNFMFELWQLNKVSLQSVKP